MAKLGGALIGYGIKKRNGEEKKVIFDKPIHNTITKSCLNNLLTFDGTDNIPTTDLEGNYNSWFVKSSQNSQRYGVFNSCCLGDGTGDTSVNDADLKHRVTEQTTTKKTGDGWCGYFIDGANSVIKLRVSHAHSISQDFTIKEIGWYNAILQDGILNYTLSSRVQLDEFVKVESGDEFYSVYEISIGFQKEEVINDVNLFGVPYKKINGLYSPANWNKFSIPVWGTNCIPYSNGSTSYADYPYVTICPPYLNKNIFGYKNIAGPNICKVSGGTWNGNIPVYYSNNGYLTFANSYISNIDVKNYEQDSFRRDVEYLLAPGWGSQNEKGICLNGTVYLFGHYENGVWVEETADLSSQLKITNRMSFSTDLLTPAG
jgi:hypothetical protein